MKALKTMKTVAKWTILFAVGLTEGVCLGWLALVIPMPVTHFTYDALGLGNVEV